MIDIKMQIKKYKSISEVADALSLSQPNLSQQLTRRTISLERLEDIAQVCGCTLSKLLACEDDIPQEITISFNGQSHTYTLKPNE